METSLRSDEWEIVNPEMATPSGNSNLSSNFLNSDEWDVVEKPKKSKLEKAGRIAGQFAMGAAENALLPYELAAAPLANRQSQTIANKQNVMEDIERLTEQKQTGVWDKQDQELLDHLVDQIKNPEKMDQYVKTADIGIRGLTEKATGLDLHPEGFVEKAANWMGFIKNPKNISNLTKSGFKSKDIVKTILPTGTDFARGIGAGAALELAEQGEFGPIPSMLAAVVGDLVGGGAAGVLKSVSQPRKTLTKAAEYFTAKEKIDLQKEIIQDFRDAGIQADIGTITNNNYIKSIQAKLSQSGLTGNALDEFRLKLTNDVKEQYKKLADELGNSRFNTHFEAGEAGKEYITAIRDAEKQRIGDLYSKARERLEFVGDKAKINPINLAVKINDIEHALRPGTVKSAEQKAVLDVLDKLKNNIYEEKGKLKSVSVMDLLNNKTALNDIINYEVQGGQKQLLKSLVHDLDKEILNYGKKDTEFLKSYHKANKDFATHAKDFRNDNINRILTSRDPMVLMNKMNTIQGIRDIDKALKYTPEGRQLFNDLKRFKFDDMIGRKMTDNVSEQLKTGTFSNLLKNPKDKQLVKEMLGEKAFSKLVKLQKVTGKIAEAGQKFLNASKSGTTLIDASLIGSAFHDLSAFLSGNPWSLLKTAAGYTSVRYITKLMADPVFLKGVEDAILASSKNDISKLMMIGKMLEQPIKAAIGTQSSQDQTQKPLVENQKNLQSG